MESSNGKSSSSSKSEFEECFGSRISTRSKSEYGPAPRTSASPILDAIQWIPGETAPEKRRELSKIVKRLAENVGAAGDFADIPEPLLPLVRARVVCITKNHEGVTTALRSEDATVRNSALSATWFFDGSDEHVASYDYFSRNLFQEVSFTTRLKIKKHLAKNLGKKRNAKLAEEFFDGICRDFGRSEAMCLLTSCGRDFISRLLEDVTLTPRMLARLYRMYPDLAIRYLRSLKATDDKFRRTTRKVGLQDYAIFLPDLIRNHPKVFLELQENGKCRFRLSNKRSVLFLKYNTKALVEKPLVYLHLLPLKLVTQRLFQEDFEAMFAQYFPKFRESFDFGGVKWCLEHQPPEVQVELTLKTFEKIYGEKLLKFPRLIDPSLLIALPEEDRIRIARIKIEIQPYKPEDKGYDVENSWICYLPLEEAVRYFKDLVSRQSNEVSRKALLCQMFYSYKANNAAEKLPEALRYYLTRHRNEKWPVLESVMECLVTHFDLVNLSHENWEVLYELLQFAFVKYSETDWDRYTERTLVAGIHHQLMHDLPCDRFVGLLLDMARKYSWNVLQEFPEYERAVLDTLLKLLETKEERNSGVRRIDCFEAMLDAMYAFNDEHEKDPAPCRPYHVGNYSWLCDELRELHKAQGSRDRDPTYYCVEGLLGKVKQNEPETYERITGSKAKVAEKFDFQDLVKDPKKVLKNWRSYYKKCQSQARKPEAKMFLRRIRWYQKIPINFLDQARSDICRQVDDDTNELQILAALMDGPNFAQIAQRFEPEELEILDNKRKLQTVTKLMSSLNYVNPPVPLEFVGKFCDGDWLHLLLRGLYGTCQRTALPKVIPFAQELAKQRVSVKKHGIRLICMVAPLNQVSKVLGELWKTETHHSIRAVLLIQIHSYFRKVPTELSFSLVKMTFEGLDKSDFDDEPLRALLSLDTVPQEFISGYLTLFFERLQQLKDQGLEESVIGRILGQLFDEITAAVAALLSEELLEKIVVEFALERDLPNAGKFLSCYLQPPAARVQKHLEFLRRKFAEKVSKDWNVAEKDRPYVFPYRLTFRRMVDSMDTIEAVDLLLGLFDSVLKPAQEPYSYLHLTYNKLLLEHENELEGFAKGFVRIFPGLVGIFPAELFFVIPQCLEHILDNRIFSGHDCPSNAFALFVNELLRLDSSKDAYLLSAHLLAKNSDKESELFRAMALKLRNSEYPSASTVMNYYQPDLKD